MNKKKKAKPKVHVTYNRKIFLAPDSLLSMAAIHTKIKQCGEVQIRISDCNQTIKLWNDLNDPEQVKEFILKITNIQTELESLKQEVKLKLPFNGKL
ncbi:hypothetical protein OX284_007670 [Flavobacterium sp. SUN046]|uniref:hypothetical protein n=1 Tax=Flavobacterium sp. SUN046 TaxID=3002440 RepID=UPI002DB910C5|nr:hypothetical protein [Flavobacterium sp. SUN046]MEC4049305.1 hypothetical protein [Flavobacterium sp. SUN046]